MSTEPSRQDAMRAEFSVLERFGLRYAVLAAWSEELHAAGAELTAALARHLEAARVKIASGCYSSCDVGCELGAAEGALTATDGDRSPHGVAWWLDLLARAMDAQAGAESLLSIPAVRFHYQGCGFGPCGCGS